MTEQENLTQTVYILRENFHPIMVAKDVNTLVDYVQKKIDDILSDPENIIDNMSDKNQWDYRFIEYHNGVVGSSRYWMITGPHVIVPKLTTENPYYSYLRLTNVLALGFMNFLDEHRPEGKMCLSNGECMGIEKAFKEQDWDKLGRYLDKYTQEPCNTPNNLT